MTRRHEDLDPTEKALIRRGLVRIDPTLRAGVVAIALTDAGRRVAEVWEGRL